MPNKICVLNKIYIPKKNVPIFELIILKIQRVDIPKIYLFTSSNNNSCASCKKTCEKKGGHGCGKM
jgi:hypothetical protein